MSFSGKVVIVTGGGGGLGKAYSDFFASRGAFVCINDLGKDAADKAVAEINSVSGTERAIANYNSVTEGDQIVKQTFDKWGRVDVSSSVIRIELELIWSDRFLSTMLEF